LRLASSGPSSFCQLQCNLLRSWIQPRSPQTADLTGPDGFLLLSTRLCDGRRYRDSYSASQACSPGTRPGSAELSISLALGSAWILPSFRGQAMGDQGFTPSWPKISALVCREPGLVGASEMAPSNGIETSRFILYC